MPGLELINADSLLVFRGMNVGTAKPTPAERAAAKHHLIDLREPDQGFTAADFARAAREVIAEIDARGGRALIVGGTGFYLKALIHGTWEAPPADAALRKTLEPVSSDALYRELEARDERSGASASAGTTATASSAPIEILRLSGQNAMRAPGAAGWRDSRIRASPRFWVIDRNPDDLERRIEARSREMVERGLWKRRARSALRYPGARALGSVGYREAVRY